MLLAEVPLPLTSPIANIVSDPNLLFVALWLQRRASCRRGTVEVRA
jgi:hypothetical protein